MPQQEIARAIVDLDGRQAGQVLNTLKKQAKQLRAAIRESEKAGDVSKVKKLKAEVKDVTRATKAFKNASHEVNVEMDKMNGQSMNNLKKAQRSLLAQMNKMKQGTKEEIALYKKKLAQYKMLTTEINRQRAGMVANQSAVGKLAAGFNKYFSMVTAGAAALLGLFMGFRSTVDASNDFEARLDNLSALTGLVGEQLQWLGKKALELSQTQLESGIRITQSAGDIVDAYMRMGSLRPQLLKNKEALAAVTQDAIILSEAAKIDLMPAIEAVAITMNQFNQASTESTRIINALGAGSKVGAGNVPYLTKAMERVGTTANIMGLEIETTLGAIESFAPFFKDAGKGGRSFDRVLMRMRANQIGYKDGIFDIDLALEQLEKRFATGETSVDIFGSNHAKMADILVLNKHKFKEYEAAVTGSNIAVEQAITNTDNNSAKLEQARNRLNAISIELGEKLAPALTFSTKSFSYLLKAIIKGMKFYNKYKATILGIAAAVAFYTIAVNASIIKLRLYIIATNLAAKATRVLNLAMKQNPIVLLISLVIAAGVAIYNYATNLRDATDDQEAFNEELERANQLMNDTKSLEDRAAVIKNMSKAQLEAFIADSEFQLENISEYDEKRLVAANAFQQEVDKLNKYMAATARTDKEREAMFNNKFVTAARDKAFDHLMEMTQLVKDANAEQLQSYIDTAAERLKTMDDPVIVKKEKKAKFDPGSLDSPDTSLTDLLNQEMKAKRKHRADDIANLQDTFDAQEQLRTTNFLEQMVMLGNNEEAKAALTKEFEKQEMNHKLTFMNQMTAKLTEILNSGGIEGLSLEDALLSDEEQVSLTQKIWDLQEQIAILKGMLSTIAGDEEDAEATDFFGMTPEDWEILHAQLGKVMEFYGYFEEAVMGVNEIISNNEKQQLLNMENNNSKKKKLLAKQLKHGEITYDQYTGAIAEMDEELDQKRRKQAHDQAVREKALALMAAIINTAVAVVMSLDGTPMGIAMAAIAAALGAIQIATIATQPVPQYAAGNFYDVVGENDKKRYHASVASGSTGIYNNPSLIPGLGLVGEQAGGGELVFSNDDTNRIMNAPYLVDAIENTLSGTSGGSVASADDSQPQSNSEMMSMLALIADRVSEPSIAFINPDYDYLDNHRQAVDKLEKIEAETAA